MPRGSAFRLHAQCAQLLSQALDFSFCSFPCLPLLLDLLQGKVSADLATNDSRARALGQIGEAALAGYGAALPADGGSPETVAEPHDIGRFDATFFT